MKDLAALRAENALMRETLKEFMLGHEHAPNLHHTRSMGDGYGWCDYCSTKVNWGPGLAEQALSQTPRTEAFQKYVKTLKEVAYASQDLLEADGAIEDLESFLQKLEQAKQELGE